MVPTFYIKDYYQPNTMKKIILAGLLSIASFHIKAQSGLKSALIPCKTGAVLAYTDDSSAFTLNFITRDIHRNIDKGSYMVEGFELTPFTSDIIGVGRNESERKQKQRISKDVKSSMALIQAELNERKIAYELEWVSAEGQLYGFWHYSIPGTDKQKLAITTICHDYFFTVNSTVKNSADFETAKKLLLGLTDDLKLYGKSLDFKALYKDLNK